MILLDLPNDTVLQILYNLEVKDIVLLETACKHLFQFIRYDTRDIWLKKLYELGPVHAPDIPPHIDVKELSCWELRSKVVGAVRIYSSMTRSSPPEAKYALKETIIPPRPAWLPDDVNCCIQSIKLTPGGRYVFVLWILNRPEWNAMERHAELCILDTENASRCVWSYKLTEDHTGDDRALVNGYDFDLRREGNITLALSTASRSLRRPKEANPNSLYQVFELRLDSATRAFKEELRFSRRVHYPKLRISNLTRHVLGDFAFFQHHIDSILLIINWRENWTVELQTSDVVSDASLRIWKDYIFYFDKQRLEMRAIRLDQIKSRSMAQPDDSSGLDISQLDGSFLELDTAIDHNERDFWRGKYEKIVYSIHDHPGHSESTRATVTIIAHSLESFTSFMVIRARFDANGPTRDKWTVLSTAVSESPLYLSPMSNLSRSGRLLMAVQARPERDIFNRTVEQFSLVVVDQKGSVIFPELPEALIQPTKRKVSWFDSSWFMMNEFLEEYSSDIAVIRDKWTERDSIEIYRPVE